MNALSAWSQSVVDLAVDSIVLVLVVRWMVSIWLAGVLVLTVRLIVGSLGLTARVRIWQGPARDRSGCGRRRA
jgi:hypothetical protein